MRAKRHCCLGLPAYRLCGPTPAAARGLGEADFLQQGRAVLGDLPRPDETSGPARPRYGLNTPGTGIG